MTPSACAVACLLPFLVSASDDDEVIPVPVLTWSPRTYTCLRNDGALTLDGRLDEDAWQAAPWSTEFADISGPGHAAPTWRTRMKLLWDDDALYVGAELEEPHVWANLTERDSVIFFDNDFEVFLDPDGDTHNYYELEVNALATEWDLFLVKPYRDGGPALHAWDIPGLKTAVHVDGTLNDPSDVDRGWSVEIAIPWGALAEAATVSVPPQPDDVWWANFSRVEWDVEVRDGAYVKVLDPDTGEPRPEHNWVWTPQGLINMHYPEQWGLVRFLDAAAQDLADPIVAPDHRTRMLLRNLYYAQSRFRARHGSYDPNGPGLRLYYLKVPGLVPQVEPTEWAGLRMLATPNAFEASLPLATGGRLHIFQDGRILRVPDQDHRP